MTAGLRRCLGPLEVTAQAVGTMGLTLTAVINIPQAMHTKVNCFFWTCHIVSL